ncbi:MAG: hypothetical protein JOS17DRAFT_772482 [Linnemannia elongata]|nr:MAG: hypothetical protein JOS17DRAFT_772482 [Linnemannia elongata]
MAPPEGMRIIIVGGGLAGLMMGIMLDHAGIDYHILEQASRLRPLGTSISLHPVIRDLMDQLGLLEEMEALSKPMRGITVLSAKGRRMGRIDTRTNKRRHGHQAMVMSRPDLHEFLRSKISPDRLTTGKRVIDITETPSEVTVTCMDETTYVGHLVIGADGAYSAVRQIMYKKLQERGLLPEVDKKPLHFDKQCVVGMTAPLDPARYPVLLDEQCEVKVLLGKDQHTSMWFLPLQGNRIAWCVGGPDPHQLLQSTDDSASQTSQGSGSHNSGSRGSHHSSSGHGRDWYPETIVEICEDVRNFKCPYGGSVMDLIEATPKGMVSKVLLEEKMYRTWYHGRIVLVGDSCHKIVPFFGQGASQAILDCACLTNLFFDLRSTDTDSFLPLFQEYVDIRMETSKIASDSSREFADLIYDQGFKADIARKIVLRYTPSWLLRMITGTIHTDKPFLKFLSPPTRKIYPNEQNKQQLKQLKQQQSLQSLQLPSLQRLKLQPSMLSLQELKQQQSMQSLQEWKQQRQMSMLSLDEWKQYQQQQHSMQQLRQQLSMPQLDHHLHRHP